MSTIIFGAGGIQGGALTATIPTTVDINLTDIDIVNDTTPTLGGNLDANAKTVSNVNELTLNLVGGSGTVEIGSVTPNNAFLKQIGTGFSAGQQRRVGQYYGLDHGSGDVFKGGHYFRHRSSGTDEFHLFFTSDNGQTADNFLFVTDADAVTIPNNYDLNIDGGKVLAGVIECATVDTDVNSIVNVTTMPVTDNLHNHVRMTMDYGTNNIPDGANGLLNFSMKSDAEGDLQTARIGARYDTNDNNVLRVSASDNNGNFTDYDFGYEAAIMGAPVQLASYSVSSAPSRANTGEVIYVSDGDAGSPCLAVYDGSWKRVALGATISAT